MPRGKSDDKSKRKDYNLRSATKQEEERNKYKNNNSSSDEESDIYDEEENFDMLEYRNMLSKIFPSSHMKKTVDAANKLLKAKQALKTSPKRKSDNKKCKEEDDVEEDYDEDDEYEEEGDDYHPFNIILNVGDFKPGRKYEEDYSDEETDEEDYDEDEDDDYTDDEEDETYRTQPTRHDDSETDHDDDDEKSEEENDASNKKVKYTDKEVLAKFIAMAEGMKENCRKNNMLEDLLKIGKDKEKILDKKEKKQNKKQIEKNCKLYKQLSRDKNIGNDFAYFKKLDISEQKEYIKEMNKVAQHLDITKPYRFILLDAPIPANLKAVALKKINALRIMEPGSGEYYKVKTWVDTFMRIPFEKYSNLPIHIDDGVNKCHEFMQFAKKTLDEAVYGLNDAKMQIMQMIGQWITNPSAVGTAIAIQGPMGTGKTTLVKEGISKIMNRYFAFIALGGATDSSFLEGHSYTYEGSTWGKLIDIAIQSKTMNPIIYFDELDKISDTPRGQEIVGILTHLTDTAQNDKFHDKYFAEVDFDFSKSLFIFSYNEEEKVNPILKDRMYRIKTKGYTQKDKVIIANQYLLPKIREQIKFKDDDIVISEKCLGYIIENHTNNEDGVRNLKRCLEIIHKKINLYRLMKPGTNLFEEDMSLEVKFPFTVSTEMVDKLVKEDKDGNKHLTSMYM